MAETRHDANPASDHFLASYEAKYPKATRKLAEDREDLINSLDFPAEHWQSIQTTNPIEVTFATIRHRPYHQSTLDFIHSLNSKQSVLRWVQAHICRGFQLCNRNHAPGKTPTPSKPRCLELRRCFPDFT